MVSKEVKMNIDELLDTTICYYDTLAINLKPALVHALTLEQKLVVKKEIYLYKNYAMYLRRARYDIEDYVNAQAQC
jgi:hypothetical protein